MKKQYLVMLDGKFLTSVFAGGKFEAVSVDAAYRYTVREIAEDVARALSAVIVEVSRGVGN